jgi:peptidoglycan hydrolase CwlO-like protein
VGKGKPRKSFERDGKEDGKLKSVQKALKEKDREIKQLRSELKTLEAAFKKAAAYMSKESKELSVEELIKAADKSQTLEQAKKEKVASKSDKPPIRPPTKEELEQRRKETLEKVKKWREQNLGKYEEE